MSHVVLRNGCVAMLTLGVHTLVVCEQGEAGVNESMVGVLCHQYSNPMCDSTLTGQ